MALAADGENVVDVDAHIGVDEKVDGLRQCRGEEEEDDVPPHC